MATDLVQSAFSNLWSIFLVVLFFGGSIFVHELGHFLLARRRGVHVERFSIGFGPAIWSWRGKDGVEYRLSWIPLGGYVLLPQLADLGAIEGKSETDISTLPPVGYATRMLVFVAGAVFNILFAFALATVVWIVGQPESSATATTRIGYVTPTVELPGGKVVPSPARDAGLQVGDTIRAIDGSPVENWQDVLYLVGLGSGQSDDGRRQAVFTVERDGRTLDLVVHPRLVGEERDRKVGIAAGYELLVQDIAAGSVAERAGFKPGDELVSLDGVRIFSAATYFEQIGHVNTRAVAAVVRRGGAEVALTIPQATIGKAGFPLGLGLATGVKITHPKPWKQVTDILAMSYRTLWSLVNPRSDVGISNLTGPVGIVRIFHSAAEIGIMPVLTFTILLNLSLAVFNLLPIPVLDGGQMLFATIGKLRGRPLPVNFVIGAQTICGALLITMVVYLTFSDFRRWNRDAQADRAEAAAQQAPAQPAAPAK